MQPKKHWPLSIKNIITKHQVLHRKIAYNLNRMLGEGKFDDRDPSPPRRVRNDNASKTHPDDPLPSAYLQMRPDLDDLEWVRSRRDILSDEITQAGYDPSSLLNPNP